LTSCWNYLAIAHILTLPRTIHQFMCFCGRPYKNRWQAFTLTVFCSSFLVSISSAKLLIAFPHGTGTLCSVYERHTHGRPSTYTGLNTPPNHRSLPLLYPPMTLRNDNLHARLQWLKAKLPGQLVKTHLALESMTVDMMHDVVEPLDRKGQRGLLGLAGKMCEIEKRQI